MTQEELLEVAEMFDTIVNSRNEAVRRSLQHTMVLANLAREQDDSRGLGPFVRLIGEIKQLQAEMHQLKRSVQILENNSVTVPDPYKNYADNMAEALRPLTIGDISTITISGLESSLTNTYIGNDVITVDLSDLGTTGIDLTKL